MRSSRKARLLLIDDEEYFGRAFGLIDELIAVDTPTYFHIGMDEDFERTLAEYVRCIKILRKGLKARGIATMRWVDLEMRWQPRRDRIKHVNAIELLPDPETPVNTTSLFFGIDSLTSLRL